MRPDVWRENGLEPFEVTIERHFPGDRDGAGPHRVQLRGIGEHADQRVGEGRRPRRVGRDEKAIDAGPQPLAYPPHIEGDGGNAERRRLETNEAKGLWP